MLVAYTDNLGVCAVAGAELLPSRRASEAHDKGREWRKRVVSKFGKTEANPAPATTSRDSRDSISIIFDEPDLAFFELLTMSGTADGRGNADSTFVYSWKKDALPAGYRAIQVSAKPHYVRVTFAFDNHHACQAE